MRNRRVITATAAAVAATAITGSVLGAAAPAAAANVYSVDRSRTTVVELTHAETVTAAQIGAGNVINALLGNDHWAIQLERGSRYSRGDYYRPDKARIWNNVTGQQLVAEAAAHPGGRVTLAVTPSNRTEPLWIQQNW